MALWCGWDKTRRKQAMLEELGNPLRIFDISLATWHIFDVLGIDQNDVEFTLQQIVDGFPIVGISQLRAEICNSYRKCPKLVQIEKRNALSRLLSSVLIKRTQPFS